MRSPRQSHSQSPPPRGAQQQQQKKKRRLSLGETGSGFIFQLRMNILSHYIGVCLLLIILASIHKSLSICQQSMFFTYVQDNNKNVHDMGMNMNMNMNMMGIMPSSMAGFAAALRGSVVDTVPPRVFDVLSVGSYTRPAYLKAQLDTWGSHESIRNFIGVTELDDYDPSCDHMTGMQVQDYVDSCRANTDRHFVKPSDETLDFTHVPLISKDAQAFTGFHFGETESPMLPTVPMKRRMPGWFCAQRRVAQGMQNLHSSLEYAFTSSSSSSSSISQNNLPDYLVIGDDDTYFNVDAFQAIVAKASPDIPRAYSGCMFQRNITDSFHISWEFPYGGLGSVYSRGALLEMLTPIYCNATVQTPEKACASLQRNGLGEQVFFQQGMNSIELFSNYSAHSKSFCVHSDWLLGYMVQNYLSLTPPDDAEEHSVYHPIRLWPTECGNHSLAPMCNPMEDVFCHRQGPDNFQAYAKQHQELIEKAKAKASSSSSPPEVETMKKKNNLAAISAKVASLETSTIQMKEVVNATAIADLSPDDGQAWVKKLVNDTVLPQNFDVTNLHVDTVWNAPSSWITPHQLLPESFDKEHENELALVFHQLKHGKILNATSASGGTQLKLFLTLEGGQKVIFKPTKNNIGYDMHNGEIASFHISRLLNIRRAPVVVGRKINVVEELYPVASQSLLETFISPTCFYGICRNGCDPKKNSPTCATSDGTVEGAISLMLPSEYGPYKRLLALESQATMFPTRIFSEQDQIRADKMLSKDYCDREVKKQYAMDPYMLDVVETSIFDFLIQNTDRHSFESMVKTDLESSSLLWIDQGKTFSANRNSTDDMMNLLTPLIQCCVVRDAFYEHLRWMSRWKQSLSESLLELTANDVARPCIRKDRKHLPPPPSDKILLDEELEAIDRRLQIVLDTMEGCIAERGREQVLKTTHAA